LITGKIEWDLIPGLLPGRQVGYINAVKRVVFNITRIVETEVLSETDIQQINEIKSLSETVYESRSSEVDYHAEIAYDEDDKFRLECHIVACNIWGYVVKEMEDAILFIQIDQSEDECEYVSESSIAPVNHTTIEIKPIDQLSIQSEQDLLSQNDQLETFKIESKKKLVYFFTGACVLLGIGFGFGLYFLLKELGA
jgi:hypothetical protein